MAFDHEHYERQWERLRTITARDGLVALLDERDRLEGDLETAKAATRGLVEAARKAAVTCEHCAGPTPWLGPFEPCYACRDLWAALAPFGVLPEMETEASDE